MLNREVKNNSGLLEKARLVRKLILTSTTTAGSGHPTSSMSAADIGTVLFDKFFKFDLKNPKSRENDRFVLSKGHASPLLYALFAVAGGISFKELETLRKFGSRLEGHPTLEFPYADVVTGSLGQGLSVGSGMAISAKKDKVPFNTFVLLGDGEMAEGSNFEAANFATYYKLDNLIAIVDVNRLGQSQQTMFGHDTKQYEDRFLSFGWDVTVIDGHNYQEIEEALKYTIDTRKEQPKVIIAKTMKGKGVSFLENKDGWHGKPLKKEDLEKALKEIGDVDESLRFELRKPKAIKTTTKNSKSPSLKLDYKMGDEVATREIYGEILALLGNSNPLIYSLDAEVKNSTYSMDFQKVHPDRFIECFIAEQNMVGVALGLSTQGKIPFVSTFAAFLSRAYDQIRMAGISKGNVKVVGSHAGVSIGEDGASQMGLEDIAMFGALANSVIFHPSDAVSTAKILPLLVDHYGVSYLRTLRPKTPVLYDTKEEFKIGGSKVLKKSNKDILTVVSAGITVHEAISAYGQLKKENIFVRVVDCYSVKPIDKKTLVASLKETKQKTILTVEDHYEHGGLGDFVLSAVSDQNAQVYKMAVSKLPRSGTKDELLDYEGISAKHIVERVKKLNVARS